MWCLFILFVGTRIMSDHLVLCVDRLLTPDSLPSMQGIESSASPEEGSSSHSVDSPACVVSMKEAEEHGVSDEEEPLIQTVECRICQEEDSIKNLEVPCSCSGSLKVIIFMVSPIQKMQPGYLSKLYPLPI